MARPSSFLTQGQVNNINRLAENLGKLTAMGRATAGRTAREVKDKLKERQLKSGVRVDDVKNLYEKNKKNLKVMTGIQVYTKTAILDYDYFMQHQSSANMTSSSRRVFGSTEYIIEYSKYVFGTFAGSMKFTKDYTENGYDKGLTNDLKTIASR